MDKNIWKKKRIWRLGQKSVEHLGQKRILHIKQKRIWHQHLIPRTKEHLKPKTKELLIPQTRDHYHQLEFHQNTNKFFLIVTIEKSSIRETLNLSTDEDSSTNIFDSAGVKKGADSIFFLPTKNLSLSLSPLSPKVLVTNFFGGGRFSEKDTGAIIFISCFPYAGKPHVSTTLFQTTTQWSYMR